MMLERLQPLSARLEKRRLPHNSATQRSAKGMIVNVSFPGESREYRAARNRLLEQEIELRRVTEAVAAERRALPLGGVVPQDYIFQGAGAEGTPTDVRL